MNKLLIAFLFSAFASFTAQSQVDSVLFVGNSYTYGNNLTVLFDSISRAAGDTFYVESISAGGYTTESHVNNPNHINTILGTQWDYFIVQEQSQVPTIDFYFNNLTLPNLTILDSYFKTANECSNVLMFMTWGRRFGGQQCDPGGNNCSVNFADFNHMQDTLRSRYLLAAEEIDAKVGPAGEAWRLALQDSAGLVLHTGDNSHPNLLGSYLAACTFYTSITGNPSNGISYTAGLSSADAAYLQSKATQAVFANSANYMIDSSYPEFEFNLSTAVNEPQFSCGEDQLDFLLLGTYVGQKSPSDSVHFAVETYDSNGQLLNTKSIAFVCPERCTDSLITLQDFISIDENFAYALINNLNPAQFNVNTINDTLAAFPNGINLSSASSAHIETFDTKAYTASYDLWNKETDLFSGLGWEIEADASVVLSQPAEPNEGTAMVRYGSLTTPKKLISPCIELCEENDYEIRFRHTNDRNDAQSGIGFRLWIDDNSNFASPTLIEDFSLRYDSLYVSQVDTVRVNVSGAYFIAFEAYDHEVGQTGSMAIKDFQIKNIDVGCDSSLSLIDLIAQDQSLTIYPNPTNSNIFIATATEEVTEIQMFDYQGKNHSAKLKSIGKNQFDVSELSNGVYNVLVRFENGTYARRNLTIIR